MPLYVYLLITALFIPLYFKGDARFNTFLLCSNSIFILMFASLLNPYYIFSYHYPALEAMNECKVVLFALIEFVLYCSVAGVFLAWGYYLVESN